MDHSARAYPVFSRIAGYRRFTTMLASLRRFSRDEVAPERMKILRFYDQYGEGATKEAFGVDRKLIYVWRRRVTTTRHHLEGLVPESTRPHRVRRMRTEPRIVEFLRQMRRDHPRLGKEKLKVFLDEYCAAQGIPSVSVSTIGKILTRHQLFFQRAGRVYHDPTSGWATRQRAPRLRVKHPPRHTEGGHFQADTAVAVVEGHTRYFISVIDSALKVSLSACYPQLSSRHSTEVLQRLEAVYPLPIKSLQTDNGSEFLGDFDAYLHRRGIPHYFSYPRCPKINGCVERYNRTLKEEFLYNNLEVIADLPLFRQRLAEYLVFYNAYRPHKTLGLKSPLDFLVAQGRMSKMCGTHTRSGVPPFSMIH